MIKIKSFSFIRFIAMIFIILSHFTQYFNNFFFLILNIGVQLFFILSGLLYGSKQIDNFKDWFKKRFNKIILPYYLYVIIAFALLLIFGESFSILSDIWKYLLLIQGFFSSTILLGNLWFITFIVICYLIVPLLQKYDFSKEKGIIFYLKLFGILFLLLVLENLTLFYKLTSNLFCFIGAYYIARRYIYNRKELPKYHFVFKLLNLILFPIVLIIFAFLQTVDLQGLPYYMMFLIARQLSPFIFSISLFSFLTYIFDSIYNKKRERYFNKILTFSDSNSYYIYLTHHLFVLTSLSLLEVTIYKPINVIIVLIATMVLSFLIKLIISKLNIFFKRKVSL